jgi:RHS repeat-associated protein
VQRDGPRQPHRRYAYHTLGPHDPVGFGGQYGYYTDSDTGLVLCTHRYYDPLRGRWVTRDPIGYAGGMNLYGFCGNNPVMRRDPSGYQEREGGRGNLIEIWESETLVDAKNDARRVGARMRARQAREREDYARFIAQFTMVTPGQGVSPRTVLINSDFFRTQAMWNKGSGVQDRSKIILIGEGMNRGVKEAARIYGAQWYQGWSVKGTGPGGKWTAEEKALVMSRNRDWIQGKIRAGYTILNVGAEGVEPTSDFYKMELEELAKANYGRVYNVARPTGPWISK